MTTTQVAQKTINSIPGQLGSAENYNDGHTVKGAIQGQTVKPNDFGGESFTPMFFEYTAQIVKADGKSKWEIIDIKSV